MTTPLVYIVIPAWNRKHDTLACLESLLALTYPSYRIVMVDNGSTDGTAQAVGENYLNVEIIAHPKNLGFAAGVNSGIRHALERGADFVFLLNNDTLAEPSLLNRLLAYCTAGVGIVAPKIYYAADPERLWSAGGQRHPWTLEKTDDARGQPDGPRWARVLERDYLVGCAMLIPRSTLQRVGEFDERYFMYYEDMDFSWRVRAAGLKLLVAPDARLWHKVALSSGGSDSPNERYWMARGSVLFFRRYARGWRWLVVGPYRFGSAIKTTLRLLARGKWEAIAAYWRGLRDGMVQP